MREWAFFIASLAGAVMLTALAVLLPGTSPIWKGMFWGSAGILALCALALLWDLLRHCGNRSTRTEAIAPAVAEWLSPYHAAKRFCDGDKDLLIQMLTRNELIAKGMRTITWTEPPGPEEIIPASLLRTLYLSDDGNARGPGGSFIGVVIGKPTEK